MDWTGIKRAERLMKLLLIVCAIISCTYAYVMNWWPYTTHGMIIGFACASVIFAVDWPIFNKHPEGWHKAIDPEKEEYWHQKQEKLAAIETTPDVEVKKSKKQLKKRTKEAGKGRKEETAKTREGRGQSRPKRTKQSCLI